MMTLVVVLDPYISMNVQHSLQLSLMSRRSGISVSHFVLLR